MIFFDNASTTLPAPEVLKAYTETAQNDYGNPSSTHAFGREANRLLETARHSLAEDFGVAKTHRVVFLSGATEANNFFLRGVAMRYQNRGKRILTSNVEHPSVRNVCQELEKEGFEVVYLPVNAKGYVEPKTLEEAMDSKTILVSIMAVNNETGAISPLEEMAKIVHRYPKAYFHVDATQAVGKENIPWQDIDAFSFSGHKIHGLKGTGALLLRSSIMPSPLHIGGGQEGGLRSGTVDVPGAVSLALAVHIAHRKRQENFAHVKAIHDELWNYLSQNPEVRLNSSLEGSPYILNFSLLHKKASVVVEALSHDGIYVSSVSACSSKGEPISYVLEAMGKSEGDARNSIRLSFDASSTLEEAKIFEQTFQTILERTVNR